MKSVYEDKSVVVIEKEQGVDSEIYARENSLFTVHRLDKETGGLILYAKDSRSAGIVSEQITDGTMQKEYIAAFEGEPFGAEGTLCDFLFHDRSKNKSYVVKRKRFGVREAVLDYTVIRKTETHYTALIKLKTGRTHQIRVQFASRGTPVYADRRYGGKESGNIALWSHRLTFVSPCTRKTVTIVSDPTGEIEKLF